jgi:hypothetical protein
MVLFIIISVFHERFPFLCSASKRKESPRSLRAHTIAVSRRFPQRRSGFDPTSGHVGFVVDKVALGRFSLPIVIQPNVACSYFPGEGGADAIGQ